ncbi:3-deoxy-manno-octulosonate cytidylyltransferase [Nitrospira sp.]|nr:3-deoxy-manno-octulosonate cytidylyltransferase [Nitrospira sp.]
MGKAAPRVTVVIPARYGSSRFPGKPLAVLLDKPMIQHVYERAQQARLVDRVIVATDDERIMHTVEAFGGDVVMTGTTLRTGTDRVADVARRVDGECFLNLQGDEIVLSSDLLTDLIAPFLSSGCAMGTLKRALTEEDDLHNPGVVKVATDVQGDALYFSRSPIPFVRDRVTTEMLTPGLHFIHLGLYAYTRDTLAQLASLRTGRLEDAEKLEQLRALEHGIRIRVWETVHGSLRVDAPEDLAHAAEVLRGQHAGTA